VQIVLLVPELFKLIFILQGDFNMENSIKINVTYTLKDLKEYAYAKSYPGTLGRMYYLILGFIIPILFITIILAGAVLTRDTSLLITLPLTIISFTIFSLIVQAPFLLNYFTMKSNFNKSKLLNVPQCFQFNEDKLVLSSSSGNFSVLWKDIFKVKELKPCFVIYTSPIKYFLLPRRCINSANQLELLRNMFKQKIEKRKLKLKKYPLGKISLDKDIKIYNEAAQSTQIAEEDQSLLELHFSLTKEELLAVNFRLFYTKPAGIIMTAAGILLLIGYIAPLFSNGSSPIIRLLLGLFFTTYPPAIIYFKIKKGFEKDASLQKSFAYKIYNNFFIVVSEVNEHKILWSDVVKVEELKPAFMIFITKYIAHVIPKRVFEEDEEKIRMFKRILNQQNKL
jgi:hypothetical protein